MKSIIQNYLNGNLTDAKKQAKRLSYATIRNRLIDNYGYSVETAIKIANYLKLDGSFQEACDAEFAERNK